MSATLADLPPAFLAEIAALPPQPAGDTAPGQFGAVPFAGVPDPSLPAAPATVLRFSDRGYVGEPADADRPNVAFPPRLAEPPRIERSVPVLPEDGARASFQSAEVVLLNEDGALDYLRGDWSLAGRAVSLFRIPSRAPLALPFIQGSRLAELRTAAAPVSADGRLRLALREAAIDLNVPLAQPYGGTGGMDGDAALAGQERPYLMGGVPNAEGVPMLAAFNIIQVHTGPLFSLLVRDGGTTLANVGNHASLAALQSATVPDGQYATCLALGLYKAGGTPTRRLTVTAVADGPGQLAGMAVALLGGPGGLASSRYVASSFNSWPGGAAGFWWRGGTVAAALDEIAASCAGWWNSDRLGRIVGGRLLPPDGLVPTVRIERWMLRSEPVEEPNPAPRARQRVGYARNHIVQPAGEMGASSAETKRAYGQANETAIWYDPAVAGRYPSAFERPELVTGFRFKADADAFGTDLGTMHGTSRNRWRLDLGRYGAMVDFGAVLEVDHPKLAGRRWQPFGASEAGDDIRWGVWG